MLLEDFNGISGAVMLDEGLTAQSPEMIESFNMEDFEEKSFISEVDEVRIGETAEIMVDIFSEDVLAAWQEFSLDEKAEKLNEYYIRAGENLGINTKGVIVEYMPSEAGMTTFGYNSGDGYIHINQECVDDPSQFKEILDTATHEMRHQFQNDAVANYTEYSDIPKEVIEQWEYELTPGNYIDPDYDFQGYQEQAIECDARDFAENVLESYTEKMNLN